jgi:hypothetical protein
VELGQEFMVASAGAGMKFFEAKYVNSALSVNEN